MTRGVLAAVVSVLCVLPAAAQAPPAPVLVAPANGASLAQPVALQWSAVVDPDGPIASYTWQVGTSSTFSAVIASGFTNFDGENPLPTRASLSGLANGTYFWRVRATQDQGAAGFFDSPFSATGTFTITGLGPAPGVPTLQSTAGTSFHPFESFDLVWSAVPGAHYYVLEGDDDAGFSHPILLQSPLKVFGTRYHTTWGNEIPNIFYRVRAVSADNVWGRPSPTVTVHITNAAPVPPPPTPLSPVGGATIQLPFVFDWTDTPNPQINGYDIDIDDEPNFLGDIGVLMVTNITRSDYMVVPDPLVERINRLPAGNYFWRVRAIHGSVFGPWSGGQAFTVAPLPATPAGLDLFWILADPGAVAGGNPTAARIALNQPAPAGGVTVKIASNLPGVEVPVGSVTIPAGATDAVVAPITTSPVSGSTLGDLRAAFGLFWQQSSIGEWNILWGGDLAGERVIGGSAVTGTVTLVAAAPAGGVEVAILSSDTALARPPATVVVPEGETSASFSITTSPVSVPTRIVFEFGTHFEGYKSPEQWLTLLPSGSPAPPPALSTITLPPAVQGGATGTGTVTLTSPAPAGGLRVRILGSMEGDVVTPIPNEVTVPQGALSVDFPLTPPMVARTHWVLIQGSIQPSGMLHARTLRVDPGPAALSDLFAIDVRPNSLIGGQTARGTVGLRVPAPPGGESVALVTSDSSLGQVPPSVTVAAGNSTASFDVTTSPVASAASVSVTGTARGVSKTAWINLGADPNAPLQLLEVTPSVSGANGGNPINATLFMNKAAPAGGAVVTLSSSNPAAAQVPATVTIPAGLGFASFTITTSPVAADTQVTITGVFNATRTAVITVLATPGGSGSGFRSPTTNAADAGGDGNGFENRAVAAQADDTTSAVDNNSGTTSSLSCTSTGRDRHRFSGYGFNLPAGTAVQGIEVRLDARADATGGTPKMCVELSWNGGATWTAARITPTLTTGLTTYLLGGAADTWGRAWTPGELSDTGLRVRITNVANSTNRDFSLDWVAVRVTTGTASADTTPPTVSVTAPTAGATVSGTTALSATASDAVGVTRVEFLVDGALLSTDTTSPYAASWNTTSATNGTHTLSARAFDAAGNIGNAPGVGVTVSNAPPPTDTTPPTVSLTAPAAGATVSGTVTVTATAADAVGVTRVEFLVDGALLSTDTTSPYSASWNTTSTGNGAHTLSARAFDAAGNQGTSAAVSVTVSNGAPPSLALALSGVPTTIRRGQFFTATGQVTNSGGTSASGYTILISFTPTDSMRLESPQTSSQAVPSVPAGGSSSVSWQMRADKTASATVTMTLRNSAGATVTTASKTLTITD